MRFKQKWPVLLLVGVVMMSMTNCSSTDCPLNNTVSVTANFYLSGSETQTTLKDTLSVIAGGRRDTTILNRAVNIKSMQLPMGYTQTVDTLLFRFQTKAGSVTDSILISHTNEPHFVSLDCSTAFFHTITGVSLSQREPTEDFPTAIDSIVISTPQVSYDETEHLKIYIRTY